MRDSFKWYQVLFGQPPTLPAHRDFGQILDSDGTVLLCLHEWGAHGHPSLMSPDRGTPGNGVLLFFRVDDFDSALQRARSLVTQFRGATRESEHSNQGVFAPRSRTGITLRLVRSPRTDKTLQRGTIRISKESLSQAIAAL